MSGRSVLVLNGPNLNLLGKREPSVYGHETLADVEAACRTLAGELGLDLAFRQSNAEHQLIDWIHEARETVAGIAINPAGYSHTSVAIMDALAAFPARSSRSTSPTSTAARVFAITPTSRTSPPG